MDPSTVVPTNIWNGVQKVMDLMSAATASLSNTQTLDIYADSSLFGLQVTDTGRSRTMSVSWSRRGGLLPPYNTSTIFWTPACPVPLQTLSGHIMFYDTWTVSLLPEPIKSIIDIKVANANTIVLVNTATGASLLQSTLESTSKLSILNG